MLPVTMLKKTGLTVPQEILRELKSTAIRLPEGNLGLRRLNEAAELKGVQIAITRNGDGQMPNIDVFKRVQADLELVLRMPADLGEGNLTRALSIAAEEVKKLDLKA